MSHLLVPDILSAPSIELDKDEYEELLRYALATPKFEHSVLKRSEPASELRAGDRFSSVTDDAIHRNAPGPLLDTDSNIVTKDEEKDEVPSEANMEQLCPEETSSHGSTHGPTEIHETIVTELTLPDEKITQIEKILDLWSGSLKTNVLAELNKWKLSLIEHYKLQMRQEKEKHEAHVRQLSNEMENLKELLRTYEISVGRKDEVISNLAQALERQKERVELMRKFTLWRIQHVKAKQEEYANRIADRQFRTALMKKVWAAWRSLSEEKWKEKAARACQLRAEDICVELTNDYENKITELTATLEETKAEILRLHSEKEQYEDTVRKAFMRGVCALNLEAMTMFQSKDSRTDPGRPPPSQYHPPSPPSPPATTIQLEDMFSTHLSHASTSQTRLDSDSPAVFTSTAAGSGVASTQKLPTAKVITSAQQKAGRTITARITGRAEMGQKTRVCGSLAVMGVAPPMSSVIVEKHHPVTQQTISQATAAKYPRTVHHSSGSTTVRPAGQVGRMLQGQTQTSVRSIKVVD